MQHNTKTTQNNTIKYKPNPYNTIQNTIPENTIQAHTKTQQHNII